MATPSHSATVEYCRNGHLRTADNTLTVIDRGKQRRLCGECRKESQRAYLLRHPDRRRESLAIYNTSDKARANAKRWYNSTGKEKTREYVEANRDRITARRLKYDAEHAAERRAKARAYYDANKEQISRRNSAAKSKRRAIKALGRIKKPPFDKREWARRKKEQRIAAGTCVNCNNPAVTGFQRCAACRQKNIDKQRQRPKDAWKAQQFGPDREKILERLRRYGRQHAEEKRLYRIANKNRTQAYNEANKERFKARNSTPERVEKRRIRERQYRKAYIESNVQADCYQEPRNRQESSDRSVAGLHHFGTDNPP